MKKFIALVIVAITALVIISATVNKDADKELIDFDSSLISFDDREVYYSGKSVSMKIEGELPFGIKTKYSIKQNGTTISEAKEIGTYMFTVDFEDEDVMGYNEIESLTATLNIKDLDDFSSNISFKDTIQLYSEDNPGVEHTLKVEGLPAGINVTYSVEGQGDNTTFSLPGEYTFTASFSGESAVNHKEIPDMIATLKIYDEKVIKQLNVESVIIDGIEHGKITSVNDDSDLSDLVIPKNYLIIDNGDIREVPLIGIDENAFSNIDALTSVYIPESITTIGNGAFENCANLNKVDVSYHNNINNTVFAGCDIIEIELRDYEIVNDDLLSDIFHITSPLEVLVVTGNTTTFDVSLEGNESLRIVDLCDSITTITTNFKGCMSLEEVYMNGVASLGINTLPFQNCDKLRVIEMNSLVTISDSTFINKSKLETAYFNSVISVGKQAFLGCGLLSETSFDSLQSIDTTAFKNCSKLESISSTKIHSIGEESFFGCSNLESIDLSSTTNIGNNTFEDCAKLGLVDLSSVIKIGDFAFSGCSNLDIINSSNKLTTIGVSAFSGCVKLTNINLESVGLISDNAFNGCVELESVDLSSATTIGSNAFNGCNLLSIINTNNIVTIGEYAFNGCENITDINSNVVSIGAYAFNGCVKLESVGFSSEYVEVLENTFNGCILLSNVNFEYIEAIGNNAFNGCESITTLVAPKLTTIGKFALIGAQLESIDLPLIETLDLSIMDISDVTYLKMDIATGIINHNISDGALDLFGNVVEIYMPKLVASVTFANNTNLEKVNLASITTLSAGAFNGCVNMNKIIINSITAIPSNAFNGCESLTTIESGEVTIINDNAFKDCINLSNLNISKVLNIGANAFEGCNSLVIVEANALTTIGNNAFVNCIKLESLNVPNLSQIGTGVFVGCNALTTIVATGITTIGENAFAECSNLQSIDLNDVTKIGSNAFVNCINLEEISLDSVIEIGDSAFEKCNVLSLLSKPDSPNLPNVLNIGANAFKGTAIDVVNANNLTTIGANAFENCVSLSTVSITKISTLSEGSFKGCTSLTEVTLSDNINNIQGSAFEGCTLLTTIDLSKISTLGNNVFKDCTSLTTANLSLVIIMGNSAFEGCTLLETVTADKVQSTGTNAFKGCTSLMSVSLPVLTSAEEGLFLECTKLSTVNVANLSSENNLFGASQTIQTLTAQSNVIVALSENNGISYLEHLTISGESVDLNKCLVSANSIRTIKLQNSVNEIKENAFSKITKNRFESTPILYFNDINNISYLESNVFLDSSISLYIVSGNISKMIFENETFKGATSIDFYIDFDESIGSSKLLNWINAIGNMSGSKTFTQI